MKGDGIPLTPASGPLLLRKNYLPDYCSRGNRDASRASHAVLTDQDIYLFREGTHSHLGSKLGCNLVPGSGAHFAVWAPNATAVSVVGDWNGWRAGEDVLAPRADGSGIWEGAAAGVQHGQAYKYRIA